MAHPLYYSAEMVRALPDDGNRYETVHGELLVTPGPRMWHQIVLQRLNTTLAGYLLGQELEYALLQSPADISWSDDSLVQPDLFVADLAEVRTLNWTSVKSLHLVIEVLSPSTARYDRFTKRRLYQEAGVSTYWIVDPDQHTVEVWTPTAQFPVTETEAVAWEPEGATCAFQIGLNELFAPI